MKSELLVSSARMSHEFGPFTVFGVAGDDRRDITHVGWSNRLDKKATEKGRQEKLSAGEKYKINAAN